jgi:hypothetical protein
MSSAVASTNVASSSPLAVRGKRGILSKRGTFRETVAAAAISEKAKAVELGEPGSHDYSISVRR